MVDESFKQQQTDLQAFAENRQRASLRHGRDFPRQVCVSLAVFQYIMDIRVVGYEALRGFQKRVKGPEKDQLLFRGLFIMIMV